jgi:ABC-type transporter Mla subunit MlaD
LGRIYDLLTSAASECIRMSEPTPTTGEIIQFPSRLPRPIATDDGQGRLRRALEGLDAAVAGQRSAVAAWRSALADLGTVMNGLGESMQRYRASLDTLDNRVAKLHSQAVQLERTAAAAQGAGAD